ncbi:hypothetical protein LCGC14_0322890 [marine sediment metagenome]|uniref:Uncharacterized protein n=1 Tax=marine sediment metagenome TaxID=412755 RepID=A0A0F9TII9_9ZZZZ
MSADNWSVCPKCLLAAQAKHEAAKREVADTYGKIPVAEFDEKRKALGAEPTADNQEESLREDYEFFLSRAGLFTAHYTCHCSVCRFGHIFKHEERISLE